jgi:hypothetical protein
MKAVSALEKKEAKTRLITNRIISRPLTPSIVTFYHSCLFDVSNMKSTDYGETGRLRVTIPQIAGVRDQEIADFQEWYTKRLINGENFSTVASEISMDSQTKSTGGELGWN